MVDVVSIAIYGLVLGSVYALVAIGFTLILSLRGVVNLAYGGYLLFAAYAYYVLIQEGVGRSASFTIAVLATAVGSVLLYIGIIQFIEDNEEQTFVVTFLIALLLQEVAVWHFGDESLLLRSPVIGSTDVAGITLSNTEVSGVITSVVIIGALISFVKYTYTGQAIIAMSLDETGANLVGINTNRVNFITWFISGGMAGVAGIFLGTQFSAQPGMWLDPVLIAFAIIIVGGIGSIKGAVIASFAIGYIETFTVTMLSPSWRGITTFVILLLFIILRPTGLFGREVLDNE
jgi:branched-chain amino acid transport system permease protein